MNMKTKENQVKDEIITLIENSRMKFETKLRLLELYDTALRQKVGAIFLNDKELEKKDILNRSM